jgi:predicted permease
VTPAPLPRLARLFLRLTPLGSRRAEVESDLHELFDQRSDRRGPAYAARRCYADILSLWRLPTSAMPAAGPSVHPEREGVLRGVATDVVHAMRLFRRTPGVVLVATIGLGLAIGVSTAVSTILNVALFRPTGIDDPASTVRVMRAYEDGMGTSWRYPEFQQLRDGSAASVPLDAWLQERVTISTAPTELSPTALAALFVTGDYLPRLTRRTAAGRNLGPIDDRPGAPPVVVVSYTMWERLLSSDPSAVGRTLWLNGTPHTIVGVASRGFVGATESDPAVWIPITSHHSVTGHLPIDRQTALNIGVVAHIPAGTTRAQAQAVLSASAVNISAEGPAAGEAPLTGVRLVGVRESLNGQDASFVVIVIAMVTIVVGLVLLLASINVANLLLASAIARRRELGVRLAIGASRWRVVRQLLTESLLVALAGGASGFLLAIWLVPVIARLSDAPLLVDLSMDARIFTLLALVTVGAGLMTGLLPARYVLSGDVATPLKGTRSTDGTSVRPSRSRSLFIGFQAAASLLLIVVAALLGRAMVRAAHVQVGFDAERIVTIAPALGQGTYDAAGASAYFAAALDRVRAIPGVASASLASSEPFGSGSRVTIFRRHGTRYTIYHNDTRADYFSTLGLRVVRGRAYTGAEVAGDVPVAVVSDKLARDFFGGEDPVGQPVSRIVENSPAMIVGVVSDAITARLGELSSPTIYQPIADTRDARIVVRGHDSPDGAVPAIRSALLSIDPRVRLEVSLAREGLERQMAEPRALATLAGALAVLALGLAVVGLYGVTAFVTGQRTQEISVRMALGATGRDILRLLLSDSLRPVAYGLVAGLMAALAAGQVLAGVLFGVPPTDALAFGAGLAVLLVAATAAVIIPTRRAAAVDPAQSLRQL